MILSYSAGDGAAVVSTGCYNGLSKWYALAPELLAVMVVCSCSGSVACYVGGTGSGGSRSVKGCCCDAPRYDNTVLSQ